MKVLKGIILVLLSIILFLSVTVFGVAFTVHQVALNPKFISSVINEVDFSDIVEEAIQTSTDKENMPEDLKLALIDTINKMEPAVKAKLAVAIDESYDYLLGKAGSPDLKKVLGDSFMNSDFVTSVLADIDLSELVDQMMKQQATGTLTATEQQLQDAMISALDKLEPSIKKQTAAFCDPVFKYLLRQTDSIDLKTSVSQTFLSSEFISAMVDSLDIKLLTKDMLTEQLGQLPQGVTLTDRQVEEILTSLDSALKSGLKNAADPIADYLVGSRPDFSVEISLDTVMTTVKADVKEAFLTQNAAALSGFTQEQIDQAYETYWADAQYSVPANFEIDSSMFGTEISTQLDDALTSANASLADARDSIDKAVSKTEDRLTEVRKIVSIFQIVYMCLIALVVLLILSIVLIHRSVKGASRNLGIVFTIYGAIFFGATLAARYFVKQIIPQMDLPLASLETVVKQLASSLTSPLFTFSLVCLIGGIALIVVSFVFPKPTPAVSEPPQPTQPPAQSS
jgi:hypothetical protein